MQSRLIYDIKKRKNPSKTINLIIAARLIPAVATKKQTGEEE
jgi:hypothetical protein